MCFLACNAFGVGNKETELQQRVPRTQPVRDAFTHHMVRVDVIALIVAIIIIIIITVINMSSSATLTSFALECLTWPSPWDCVSLFLMPSSLFELQPGPGAAPWMQEKMRNISPGRAQRLAHLPRAARGLRPSPGLGEVPAPHGIKRTGPGHGQGPGSHQESHRT